MSDLTSGHRAQGRTYQEGLIMGIADRIRRIRRDLTRKEFAALLNVTDKAVEKWELEGQTPKEVNLTLISDIFGIPKEWIMQGGAEPPELSDGHPLDPSEKYMALKEQAARLMENAEAREEPERSTTGADSREIVETHAGRIATDLDISEYYMVGLSGGVASAGPGGVAWDRTVSRYPFKRSWLRALGGASEERLAHFRLIMISGDSMEPLISHGELVLVDTNEDTRNQVVNDGIYAIRTEDGDIIVKRLFMFENTLTIMSDNRKYKTYTKDLTNISLLDVVIGRVVWVGKELV